MYGPKVIIYDEPKRNLPKGLKWLKLPWQSGHALVKRRHNRRPKNETFEHWFCKQASKLILYRHFNCRYVSEEIDVPRHITPLFDNNGKQLESKVVIDAIGITKHDKIYAMEAKASISDFRNGFSAIAPYTYIICPRDVIPRELIPPKIGLIYVDIERFGYFRKNAVTIGYDIIKSARCREDDYFLKYNKYSEEKFDNFLNDIFDKICRRNTIATVFNTGRLPHYDYVGEEELPDDYLEGIKHYKYTD